MAPCKKTHLVLMDADKIHDYVFATGRLKEIRGASTIVNDINCDRNIGILSLLRGCEKEVYAAGGAVKVTFDTKERSSEFIKEAESLYRKKTISSSITGVEVSVDAGELEKDFGEVVMEAERELRRKKEEKEIQTQLVTSPYLRFCESCGSYQVAFFKDERYICRSCYQKRLRADDVNYERQGRGVFAGFGQHLNAELAKELGWTKADFADELSELGEISQPQTWIGFIYCDGNRMGSRLKQLKTRKEFENFSQTISNAVVEALIDSLKKHFPSARNNVLPFEPVLIGGDDLILLTVADKAIQVATDFCAGFQEKTKVSMSAGVVLAHASHPILALNALAGELASSAKRRSAKEEREGKGEVSVIDFAVISSPGSTTLERHRDDYIREYDMSCRTCRPYTCDEMNLLIDYLRKFKGFSSTPSSADKAFPRNKLNAIYDALFQSKTQAVFDLLVIRNRLNKGQKELLNEFACSFGLDDSLWRQVDQEESYETIVADFVELYGFIKA